MDKQMEMIKKYLERKKEDMFRDLARLVECESYSMDVPGVHKAAQIVKELFEAEYFKCEIVDMAPNGPTVLGILGEEREGEPILLSGHMDTVIKPDSYEKPVFRTEDEKAFGPGVLDMKGGIIIALYVVKALNECGYNERPIKILFAGDEEIGHLNSNCAQFITDTARGAKCAFNMETGLLNNALCYGRKGRIEANITVYGKQAHSGNDFEKGINAISEMSEKVIRIQALTNLEKETTVTCSMIQGGVMTNAVPGECRMTVECRFSDFDEMNRFKNELTQICQTSYIPGTSAKLVYSSEFAPFATNDVCMKFWEYLKDTAEKYQLPTVKGTRLGGGSDAAYIQLANVPVMCSMGIQGEGNHTMKEYARLDSMIPRAQLISAAILNLNDFQ